MQIKEKGKVHAVELVHTLHCKSMNFPLFQWHFDPDV